MNRRIVAVLVLAVVAGLAGCNGLFGGQSSPTPSGADGPVYDPPLSPQAVVDGHQQALRDAGTFRYVRNETLALAGTSAQLQTANVTAVVNASSGRLLATQTVSLQGEGAVYVDDSGTAYRRLARGGQVSYRRFDEAPTNATYYTAPPIDEYMAGLDYALDGTTTVGGTTVTTYTVSNRSQLTPSEHGFTVIDPSNITDVGSRLRIAADGTIRSFRYRAVGTNDRGDELVYTLRIAYRDVGTATVPTPAWLDEARARTG